MQEHREVINLHIDNIENFFTSLDLVPLSQIENPNQLFKTFNGSKNQDLEDFLNNKSLDSDLRSATKTHLLVNNNLEIPKLIGYFTLTIKPILTKGISKEIIKKVDGFSKSRKCIYFHLIAQLGLSDEYIGNGLVDYLLYSAINLIETANKIVGGRYILVDAFNCEPVVHFYERNGFTKLATLENDDISIKMIYKI